MAIVYDWIFDANKAIKLEQQALDRCSKRNSIEATYVICKQICIFNPSKQPYK